MEYVLYDLGEQKKGSIAEVQLSSATNVRLIDKVNLDLFKYGQKHTYYGGFVQKSPYRISIPESRRWFVMIDLSGQLKHSVIVHPAKLPDAR